MPAATHRAPKHLRCTHRGCRKRFKGHEGDVCPACGKSAKLDPFNNARPWRAHLCYCDGYWWGIKGSPHRMGGGACKYNPRNQDDGNT